MHVKKAFIIILALWVAACSHLPQQRGVLRQVSERTVSPQEAFIYRKKLYLRYELEGRDVWFSADLAQAKQNSIEKVASLTLQTTAPKQRKEESIVRQIPSEKWREVLRRTLQPLVPPYPNQGILVIAYNHETVLFRQQNGDTAWTLFKDMPSEVEIVGKIDSAQFLYLTLEQFKKALHFLNIQDTRFLLPLEKVPLSPFAYVDTETSQLVRLELPGYYQIKKEMTKLGFSSAFIYSFFIKSHLWSCLKAPFTTTHRLVSVGSASLYVAARPPLRNIDNIPPVVTSGPEMDLDNFNQWLDKHISRQKYLARLTLLIDGKEFFPHWMWAMQQAKESIFTNVYIFMADSYGLSVADIMKKRAAEGIDVRVIADELNTVLNSSKNPEFVPPENFVMPKYITSYLRKKSRAKARTHLNPWSTFDHSKVYIIDRKLAYTGGMNIGEEYRYTWHDMMVAMEGPVVGKLVKNFYKNWSFTGWGGDYAAGYRQLFSRKQRQVNRAAPGMLEVRLMYTKPNESEIFDAQREAIRRAKRRVYVQNAYFSDNRIINELIEARGRGVDVRVILPAQNDVSIMDQNNHYVANQLFKNGVRVYFYKGMTHVKAGVYDGWAVVGSANFDKMSLYVNKEMSLGVSDPDFVNELTTRLFEKDFETSDEMKEEFDLSWTYGLMSGIASQL